MFVSYQSYEWVRAQVAGSTSVAYRHAVDIIGVERAVWLFHEAAVQGWFLADKTFLQFWDIYYGTVHFVIPVVALVLLWRRLPERYAQWRNTLVVMTLLALVGFALYPLMPPRLLPAHYGFVDTAARVGGLGPFDSGSLKDVENLYAAMPSLHIGWSSWCAFALYPMMRRRWSKALAVAYPFATLFAIVVTANHYVLDGVGGLVVLGLGWLAACGMRRWAQR